MDNSVEIKFVFQGFSITENLFFASGVRALVFCMSLVADFFLELHCTYFAVRFFNAAEQVAGKRIAGGTSGKGWERLSGGAASCGGRPGLEAPRPNRIMLEVFMV
ncbi:MAG: hypothetical protein WD490_06100 [Opitutales bacterium]